MDDTTSKYVSHLLLESAVVGAALVPAFLLVNGVLASFKMQESTRRYASVFLSGALFHIVAQETGATEWWLVNSALAEKNGPPPLDEEEFRIDPCMCDGVSCGYQGLSALFSHESFHP
jgi:hypothetical protein